ncbi:MAG: PorT family protein [Rikenellaceae bacterium]|nr:PorT family protein [Rikenellaceae bacterium]
MKRKFYTLSLCFTLFSVCIASTHDRQKDIEDNYDHYSTNLRTKNYSMKNEKWYRTHTISFGGFGVGYSGLVENLGNLSVPDDAQFLRQEGKSINFKFYLIDYTYNFHPNWGVATGLELEYNNFRFEENMTIIRDPQSGYIIPDYSYTERGIILKKSKLVTGYLNIPLLLKLRWGNDNKWYLQGGFVGGWRIHAHTKIKASDKQLNGKFKNHKNLNLRNFHYGYNLGFGYKYYGIYASYYPQSIFKTDFGPSVQQVNIGLSLKFGK